MRKNSFIQGALILTVAGIIVKFIGAFSRIYLSRLLGGEGIGLYQMAYPIYLLCLSVSSAGLPVAISIMVAERNAVNDYLGGQKVFRISMLVLLLTGFFFSALLFFGADWLVESGMVRDPRAYWSLIALSPAVLGATLLATLRGYFQGLQLMTPTAVSQILEQIVRVVTMIAFALVLLPYGLEYGAAGATLGAAPGAFVGIAVLIGFYYMTRNWRGELEAAQDKSLKPQTALYIIKRLLVLAIPVSLANIMLPIVSNIDLFIVPRRLEVAGFAVEEATTLFGYLTGMATALVNMPTIVTASLAASLVPVISEAIAQKRDGVVLTRTETAMRLANLITIPSFVGMCVIATPISSMLYATPDAGPCIAVMSFGVFLLGVQQVTTGVLQGMGKTAIPFINMVISAAVKVFLSWNLTALPAWGVLGAAWATIISQAFSAAWVLAFLCSDRASLRLNPKQMRLNWKTVSAILALGVSPFIMASTESLVGFVLNSSLKAFGDIYVSALAIMQSAMLLVSVPLTGFAQGFIPIVSYNYGHKDKARVQECFKIVLLVMFSFNLLLILLMILFPEVVASAFTNDERLIATVAQVMPLFLAGMSIFGLQRACQNMFVALGQAKVSVFIALLRKVFLLIPLALILPNYWGTNGVFAAEAISDATAAICCTTIFAIQFPKILNKLSITAPRHP